MNKYKIDRATQFSQDELALLKSIVLNAGEVDSKSFDRLISHNPILILYPDIDAIEAVGALKIPNESYKKKVFNKSKTNFLPDEFEYELGWIVSTKPGNGKAMTKILANYRPNVYATVRNENKKMKHILESTGFIRTGDLYDSKRGNYKLNLYVKESFVKE